MISPSLFIDGLKLSYLDAGGEGQALIAWHAHLLGAEAFAPLAADIRRFFRPLRTRP